ncbi:MAG TPA: hypothetical protein VND91_04465, partial [Candidatus Saccharimonadia bacterium]|nr:hypothetical protein [Candidatus Saccharimonadia bacterium]
AALGEIDRAEAVLDRFVPRPPEPPGYAETIMSLRWARGEHDGALAWIEGPGARMVQEPWRGVLRARALAQVGRRDEALALYRERFSDPGNRDMLATSSYALHLGLGEIANWVVLERESGGDGAEGLAYFQGRIATMTRGGFGLPVLDYYRAVDAALRGDVAAADVALGAAIAGGWLDPITLDTDLVWRPIAGAEWFVRRRAELDAAIAAQREAIARG